MGRITDFLSKIGTFIFINLKNFIDVANFEITATKALTTNTFWSKNTKYVQ